MASGEKDDPITIKKYANRRLYNTATSKYVTLDDLAEMVKAGVEFVVVDAKSGEDLTRSVLTQIIFEEESKGQNLLPIAFLRQLIGFYGDSLESMLPNYLEHSMQAFAENQERMRGYMQGAVGGVFPFTQWEEIGKQNMAMFERAMEMFTPFGTETPGATRDRDRPGDTGGDTGNAPGHSAPEGSGAGLDSLRAQLEALQRQVDSISRGKRPAEDAEG